ncbi:hypothetical protein lbkm_0973 [Lachnospiraceae bacterium KM106-2]|nr:hypothetical protein lbkm_0973 [Lachnospiraceae bacterium KM106-2]
MANFCGKCGRPLADGEVCNCTSNQSTAVNNDTTYTAAQNNDQQVTAQATGVENQNGFQTFGGSTEGAQTAQQTENMNQMNFNNQQPTNGAYMNQGNQQTAQNFNNQQAAGQPNNFTNQGFQQGNMNYNNPGAQPNQGYYSNPNYQNNQQGVNNQPNNGFDYQKAADNFKKESKNFFGKAVSVLKQPITGTAQLMQKKDALFGYEAIGIKALVVGLLLLITLLKADSPEVLKPFLLSVICLVIIDYTKSWIYYLFGTLVFKSSVPYQGYFAITGATCVYETIVMAISAVFIWLVPSFGMILFYAGMGYVMILGYVMYIHLVDVAADKKALFLFLSSLLICVLIAIICVILMSAVLSYIFSSISGDSMMSDLFRSSYRSSWY